MKNKKRSVVVRNRKKKLMRAMIWIALIALGLLFVKMKSQSLVKQGGEFLRGVLSQKMGLNIRVGKVSGNLFGNIRLQNVRITDDWSADRRRDLFRAREIKFHYRLLDFFSKRFNAKVLVIVENPEVSWRPHIGLKSAPLPLIDWMRDWALSQRSHLRVEVRNLRFTMERPKWNLEGIQISFEDNAFDLEVPFRHATVSGSDISSVVKVHGAFERGFLGKEDLIRGQLYTEGTVINWKPLAGETRFDYVFTPKALFITTANFLNGIEISGKVDFEKDYDIDFYAKTRDYALSNLDIFFGRAQAMAGSGKLDLELELSGSPLSPKLKARARIQGGMIGSRPYKAMDIHLDGNCPTLRLTDSRVLMPDGAIMKFADKTLEIRDLMSMKTYETLVSEAQQDTVVWGDWEFKRPQNGKDQSEFLVERAIGDNARLHFREYKADEKLDLVGSGQREPGKEFGFEYKLLSKDSLKFSVKDDEKFVGVERKMKF